jgi:hypothetical protein
LLRSYPLEYANGIDPFDLAVIDGFAESACSEYNRASARILFYTGEILEVSMQLNLRLPSVSAVRKHLHARSTRFVTQDASYDVVAALVLRDSPDFSIGRSRNFRHKLCLPRRQSVAGWRFVEKRPATATSDENPTR